MPARRHGAVKQLTRILTRPERAACLGAIIGGLPRRASSWRRGMAVMRSPSRQTLVMSVALPREHVRERASDHLVGHLSPACVARPLCRRYSTSNDGKCETPLPHVARAHALIVARCGAHATRPAAHRPHGNTMVNIYRSAFGWLESNRRWRMALCRYRRDRILLARRARRIKP